VFIPNTQGKLSVLKGFNLFGEPDFDRGETVPCAVVKLIGIADKTSVRTDSSASRGNAEETLTEARILFPANVEVSSGDRFEINGFTLRVQSVHPRYNITGKLDHFDVALEKWITP
jgi:hypothetical protein